MTKQIIIKRPVDSIQRTLLSTLKRILNKEIETVKLNCL